MSSFDHPALTHDISQSMGALRKALPEALRRLGCTREGLEEMLAVCVYMGGGPALMYASETLAAWDAFAPAT
jgi:alkylhydroperoxidase/carboxymuconolactone decarboxylase family protein YurZ